MTENVATIYETLTGDQFGPPLVIEVDPILAVEDEACDDAFGEISQLDPR